MEQEVLQVAQHMARLAVHHHLLLTFGEVIHHRSVRIQLRAVLIEVGHFEFRTAVNAPTVGLKLSEHQFQQRGFTAAVRANQGDFVAALDLSRELFHQDFTVNLIVHVFHFEDNLAGTGGLFHLHFGAAHHFTAFATFTAHGLQGTHAAFVTGTAGFNPLADPHLFLRQLAVKLGILQLFHAQVFFFLQQIGIVIAWISHQLTAVEIDNTRRHIANKRTVVRDEDDGAAEGFQEPFQPVNRFDIQVVGGFVQQQHLRPADQRATQGRFTQPATGERGQLHIRFETKLCQHLINTVFKLPQAVVIEHLLHFRQLVEILVARVGHHQMRNLMIALQVFSLLRDTFRNEIVHAAGHVARWILLQAGDNQILFVNNPPVIQALFTVEDFHQRGFTRAIAAHQTDALVIFDVQFGIIEKWCVAE